MTAWLVVLVVVSSSCQMSHLHDWLLAQENSLWVRLFWTHGRLLSRLNQRASSLFRWGATGNSRVRQLDVSCARHKPPKVTDLL